MTGKKSTPGIIAEWDKMRIDEQMEMIVRCIKSVAKRRIGKSKQDRYLEYYDTVLWKKNGRELDDIISDVVVRVAGTSEAGATSEKIVLDEGKIEAINALRQSKGKDPITLVSRICLAADAAILAVWRSDIKHGRVIPIEVITENGDIVSVIDTIKDTHYNTAKQAVTNIILEHIISRSDGIDCVIIDGLRDGYTEREIAARVGLSHVAIHKRIVKLRKKIAAMLGEYDETINIFVG